MAHNDSLAYDGTPSPPLPPLRIVLVEPMGAHNLGSVARLCGNYDVDFWLVNPQCAVLDVEAVMMATFAQEKLARAPIVGSVYDAISGCVRVIGTSALARDHRVCTLDAARAQRFARAPSTGTTALLFGNERDGLPASVVDRCDELWTLPAPSSTPTLNLSHAVGAVLAILYSATHQDASSGTRPDTQKAGAYVEQVAEALQSALVHRGYFKRADADEVFERRLLPLVRRMNLDEDDAHGWSHLFQFFKHGSS
jgi:tRNA/rRNA methyltransferase